MTKAMIVHVFFKLGGSNFYAHFFLAFLHFYKICVSEALILNEEDKEVKLKQLSFETVENGIIGEPISPVKAWLYFLSV